MQRLAQQKGFTIIELMIATTIFSVILLLCSYVMVRIGNMYYKGITTSRTQGVVRTAMDMISQDIEFADTDVITGSNGNLRSLCVGHHNYTYQINAKIDVDTAHALFVENRSTPCATGVGPSTSFNSSTDQELLGKNMRLGALTIQDADPVNPNKFFRVNIRVIYGDDDLLIDQANKKGNEAGFDINTARCADGIGSQFCAISSATTYVQKRL